jgi:hypothetical protein
MNNSQVSGADSLCETSSNSSQIVNPFVISYIIAANVGDIDRSFEITLTFASIMSCEENDHDDMILFLTDIIIEVTESDFAFAIFLQNKSYKLIKNQIVKG